MALRHCAVLLDRALTAARKQEQPLAQVSRGVSTTHYDDHGVIAGHSSDQVFDIRSIEKSSKVVSSPGRGVKNRNIQRSLGIEKHISGYARKRVCSGRRRKPGDRGLQDLVSDTAIAFMALDRTDRLEISRHRSLCDFDALITQNSTKIILRGHWR